MGLLDNFEQRLERVVNGAFSKTFRSGVQPLEITAALRRELDVKAAVVSRERILVPNDFRVHLAKTDYEKMHAMGGALVDELVQLVENHAAAQSYSFAGPVRVTLEQDPDLTVGIIRVISEHVREEGRHLDPHRRGRGRRFPLEEGAHGHRPRQRGRHHGAGHRDSRKHVQILWDGTHAQVPDLGSTNGSQLNGPPVTKASAPPRFGRPHRPHAYRVPGFPQATPPSDRPTSTSSTPPDGTRSVGSGANREPE